MKTQLGLGWTKALWILSLYDWGVWKLVTLNFEEEESLKNSLFCHLERYF